MLITVAPSILLMASMTSTITPASEFTSAWITISPRGLSRRMSLMVKATSAGAIFFLSIKTSLLASMAIRIAKGFAVALLSTSGRTIATPGSLMNCAVTMKKIRRMNTTSSMGVRSISLLVSAYSRLARAIVCRLPRSGLGDEDVHAVPEARVVGLIPDLHHHAAFRFGVSLDDNGTIGRFCDDPFDVRPDRADVGGPAIDVDQVRFLDEDQNCGNRLLLLLVSWRRRRRRFEANGLFPGKRRRHDEKDQQDEHHVQHRGQVDLGRIRLSHFTSAHQSISIESSTR